MLIEANIVLFKCILNSDNRRSSPGVDSRAMSWPTWRRAPETDWATEHVVQRFRKKYFLRKKIFLAEKIYFLWRKIYFLRKNIFLGEKYISCGEKYFLRKKIFLAEKNIFLAEKNLFLAEKIYFLRRKIFLAEKKYISCGEKYFLRKNIFCTMLPISFRKMLLDDLRQNLCSVKSPNWFDRSPAMVSLIFTTSDGSH